MARKIDISFKNTTKEKEMYEYFANLEDRSAEIKQILYMWYKKNKKGGGKEETSKELGVDITNF
ncbi:hypothetical protein [uncultured Clostridium sp.]|uniref:hypothetical protein n=1 Tax=uncultured Clostridium sp. TaxID=59620 RepID=UPI0026725D89|nr:hypothetical protein [uncultured Clostridium sp.]